MLFKDYLENQGVYDLKDAKNFFFHNANVSFLRYSNLGKKEAAKLTRNFFTNLSNDMDEPKLTQDDVRSLIPEAIGEDYFKTIIEQLRERQGAVTPFDFLDNHRRKVNPEIRKKLEPYQKLYEKEIIKKIVDGWKL